MRIRSVLPMMWMGTLSYVLSTRDGQASSKLTPLMDITISIRFDADLVYDVRPAKVMGGDVL